MFLPSPLLCSTMSSSKFYPTPTPLLGDRDRPCPACGPHHAVWRVAGGMGKIRTIATLCSFTSPDSFLGLLLSAYSSMNSSAGRIYCPCGVRVCDRLLLQFSLLFACVCRRALVTCLFPPTVSALMDVSVATQCSESISEPPTDEKRGTGGLWVRNINALPQ